MKGLQLKAYAARSSARPASLVGSLGLSAAVALGLACGDPTNATPDKPVGSSSPSSSATVASTDMSGVDTSTLTPNEKKELMTQLGDLLAPCANTPVKLGECITQKRDCKACLPAAQFLLRQVRAGRPKADRATAYTERFDPKVVKTIEIADSPFKGPEDAVVTIVEWADFECPYCLIMSPMLDSLIERFPGQVRLVYKLYPLSGHKNGEIAARAAVAGLNQGKFWEIHHALFDNQGKNDRAGLVGIAKELKLDMAQFKKDIADDETMNRIDRDKKQADALGLDGTPLIYVDGRKVVLEQLANPYEDLEAWVKLDIEMAGKTPNPPSKAWGPPGEAPHADGSASAAPSSSAAPAAPSSSAAPSPSPSTSTSPSTGSSAPKPKN